MINRIYRWFHKRMSACDERGKPSAGIWQNKIRRKSLEMCRNIKGRFLEIGCGEGLFLALLAEENKHCELYGVDMQKSALAGAEKFLKEKYCTSITLCEAQAARLPYQDSNFDGVACINLLYNLATLQEVEEMLREAGRVLKPGGFIVFDFKNSRNPLVRLKYRWAAHYDVTIVEKRLPLTTQDPVMVRSMLLRLGFLAARETYLGFPWNQRAPIVIVRAQKKG